MTPLHLTTMALASVSLAKEKNFIIENWKPILGIGTTIGVTYVVWSIYSDWKKNDTENPTKDLKLKQDSRFETSSLTDSEALFIANRLQEAMGTFANASKEEVRTIMSLLEGKSYNDFVKISDFFGERGYITFSGISKDSDLFAPKKNLSYWLSKELSPEDLDALRQVIPNTF